MQDRPTTIELLRGVEHFLSEEAVSKLEGAAQFQARVAANAVRMAIREMEGEEADLRDEYESLASILGGGTPALDTLDAGLESLRAKNISLNEALSHAIKDGLADQGEYRARVVQHLRRITMRKLAVVNPAMAGILQKEFDGQP